MRENKYRGKSINSGEWLFGDLLQYADSAQIWVNTPDGKWNYIVDPGTVGQYTGLKDKNGLEVFEGDIIGWGPEDHAPDSEVFYDDGAFKVSDPYSDSWEYIIDVLMGAVVIGNIYENPELLSA